MSYSSNPVDIGPSGLERLLEGRYVWLLVSLLLAMDIGASLFLGTPLVAITLEQLDKSAPLGALLISIALFSLGLTLVWRIRYWFYLLTGPLAHPFWGKKTLQEFKNKYTRLKESCVFDSSLLDYALRHDHQVFYNVYHEFKEKQRRLHGEQVLVFTAGTLLAVFPWLPTSSLHLLVFSRFSISAYWALLPAGLLMVRGAYGDNNSDGWIYVGSAAAKMIASSEDKRGI
jgi:hypothetical protein